MSPVASIVGLLEPHSTFQQEARVVIAVFEYSVDGDFPLSANRSIAHAS
jgi:hypothetical protein